jgi:hypothetical protein
VPRKRQVALILLPLFYTYTYKIILRNTQLNGKLNGVSQSPHP